MINSTYKKCKYSNCGKIKHDFTENLEFSVVSEHEAIIQPSATAILPIKIRKTGKWKKMVHCEHLLWELSIDTRTARHLNSSSDDKQPIRPCCFGELALTNNSTKPYIVNPGQVLAKISNGSQLSFSNWLESLKVQDNKSKKDSRKPKFMKSPELSGVKLVKMF